MRCLTVIEAQRPGLDSVLIWETQDALIAFAYLDGRVMMTRPLQAVTLDQAATEAMNAFQITEARTTRIGDWTTTTIQATPARARW